MVEDLTLEIRDTLFIEVETDIPRWKSGIKLKMNEPRKIFDEIYYLVKQNGGKYSKDADCWIFSSAKRRASFVNAVRTYQQYSSDPELAKIEKKLAELEEKKADRNIGMQEWKECLHEYTELYEEYCNKGGKKWKR